jgi:integrase
MSLHRCGICGNLSLMMLATGCRVGECLAIGWDEVDLDRAAVDVCWPLVRRTGVGLLRLASTKTGHRGDRLIPLPSWVVTMLKRRRLAIAAEVQAVFPGSLGGWRDPSNVRRVWRQSSRQRRDRWVGQPHVAQDRRELPR